MGINSWLHGWCRREGFGFYNNGTFFNGYNLLERDGSFGNKLANLMWRAFKLKDLEGWGAESQCSSHPIWLGIKSG